MRLLVGGGGWQPTLMYALDSGLSFEAFRLRVHPLPILAWPSPELHNILLLMLNRSFFRVLTFKTVLYNLRGKKVSVRIIPISFKVFLVSNILYSDHPFCRQEMWVGGDKWSNCTKYNGIVVIWIYSNIQDMLTGEEHLFTLWKGTLHYYMISERKLTRSQERY